MWTDSSGVVKVGIADLNIVKAPGTIRTQGLGSCVGTIIYDDRTKIAGLSHILLPDSNLAKRGNMNAYKYADLAIPLLIQKLVEAGASNYALKAKMAGGAQMFKSISDSSIMRIGLRNAEACKEQLGFFRIPIIASDLGGSSGRTIEFHPDTSKLEIRKVNQETFYI